LLAHTVITPKQPGWMDEVDKAIAVYKPDSWKSYTIGDPLARSKFPWRLDDEQVMYPFYDKAWQIEALRRLEIPEDMQKKYGFAPLGGADSAIKQLIFGGNAARMYRINLKAADNIRMPTFSEDRLAALKSEYELAAKEPSNLRYGYVRAA